MGPRSQARLPSPKYLMRLQWTAYPITLQVTCTLYLRVDSIFHNMTVPMVRGWEHQPGRHSACQGTPSCSSRGQVRRISCRDHREAWQRLDSQRGARSDRDTRSKNRICRGLWCCYTLDTLPSETRCGSTNFSQHVQYCQGSNVHGCS